MLRQVSLNITPATVSDLKTLAMGGYPYEVCGVIHEHGVIHQYPNTFCGDRTHGFDMEVDIMGGGIKAIWHSHPDGPNGPSADDVPCMESLASHGYNFPWLIVTMKSVTEWIFESANVA